jgi:hypothetical protein
MAQLLALLAALFLGLLAGAMFLIATAIVPYWRSLEAAEFTAWFRKYSPLVGRVMLPLGASATLFAIIAAFAARSGDGAGFLWLTTAAGLAVIVAAVYPVYFTSANAALAGGDLQSSEVAVELGRWRAWHWLRTSAGLLAFLAALCGLAAE